MGNSTESGTARSNRKRVLVGTVGALGIAAAAFTAGSWAASSGTFTLISHDAPVATGPAHDGGHDMKCCKDMDGMKMDMPGMKDHMRDHEHGHDAPMGPGHPPAN